MNDLTYISTHAAGAKARLLYQYRGRPNIEALITSLSGDRAQQLEDSLFTLYTRLDIDLSEGVQLDNIGELVGQTRGGQSDAVYRLFLKAKAGKNVSEGDINQVLSVWKLITGGTAVQLIENYPAEVELYSDVPVPDELAAFAFAIMQEVVAAGVRVVSSVIAVVDPFGFEGNPVALGFDSILTYGENTSVTAFKLIDSGAAFLSEGLTPDVSKAIHRDTLAEAFVVSVDSDIQLTLDADIFTSTPAKYEILSGVGGHFSYQQGGG